MAPGKFIDMIGKRSHRLLVIDRYAEKDKLWREFGWLCKCDCGRTCTAKGTELRSGRKKSCGCFQKDNRTTNIIGMRFGRLTAIKFQRNAKTKRKEWLCKCDCGGQKVVDECRLKSGKTISCGCYHKELISALGKRTAHTNLAGWAGHNRLPYGQSAINNIYAKYKYSALKRHKAFDLTVDQFKKITSLNCFYCGIEPLQIAKTRHKNSGDYHYNGLDRIDSSKGYVVENVVACCWQCNRAKFNDNFQMTIDWATRLLDYLKAKKKGG